MKRQVPLWVIALLAVGFIGLGGYHWLNRGRYQANERLLAETRTAPLAVVEDRPLGVRGEWPQWRGPHRDGVVRDGKPIGWSDQAPEVVWSAPMGRGYSSVAVADGRVFTQFQEGDDEIVVCLDAADGKEVWRQGYLSNRTGDTTYGPCPRATPTVDGERVYTVGGGGQFHCFDAATGKIHWRHNLLQEFNARQPKWDVAGSPLIDGDLVIVHPGSTENASVVAFNKIDGKLVWRGGDDVAGYSSPIAGTIAGRRQLLMFSGTALVGYAPESGAVLWRFPWPTQHYCNAGTPIIRGDYVFVSSGYGKGCALVKVSATADGFRADEVYAHNGMCNHFSSSVLVGEHIYGFNDGTLTCIDFRTGQDVAWTKGGLGRGSLIVANDVLVVLGENGLLQLAEATPQQWTPRQDWRFSRKRCWSAPVAANGRLYVRDEQRLVCLRAGGLAGHFFSTSR